MPKELPYIRTLREFTRGDLTIGDLPALEAEMYGSGNDRARVLMHGAMIEAFLEFFLTTPDPPHLDQGRYAAII